MYICMHIYIYIYIYIYIGMDLGIPPVKIERLPEPDPRKQIVVKNNTYW